MIRTPIKPGRRARRTKTVRLAAAILFPLLMVSLSACSSIFISGPTLTVRMGIVGASQPLWRYVAAQKETLLRPSGYEVSFRSFANEGDLKRAFVNNEIDVLATLPPQVPVMAQEGAGVQYFSPIAWLKEGYPIVVPTESPIQSPADLQGRRLSTFPSDHPGFAYWQAFIQANYNFRLADKTNLAISQNPDGPLLNGDADAATMDSVAWGQLKPTGKFRAVSDLATEWARVSGSTRPLIYGGYVARADWIQKNKKFVDDFIQANYKALQSYRKDQKAFLDTAAAYNDADVRPMPADILKSVADYLGMTDVAPERAFVTDADVSDHNRVFELMTRTGYLKPGTPPAATLFYISDQRPKS